VPLEDDELTFVEPDEFVLLDTDELEPSGLPPDAGGGEGDTPPPLPPPPETGPGVAWVPFAEPRLLDLDVPAPLPEVPEGSDADGVEPPPPPAPEPRVLPPLAAVDAPPEPPVTDEPDPPVLLPPGEVKVARSPGSPLPAGTAGTLPAVVNPGEPEGALAFDSCAVRVVLGGAGSLEPEATSTSKPMSPKAPMVASRRSTTRRRRSASSGSSDGIVPDGGAPSYGS
jgi:hypothetical protein